MSEKKICIYNALIDSHGKTSLCFRISPGVQFKEVPTNGEEYLLKVMRERQNYPSVTMCTKDYSQFAKKQFRFAIELPYATAPDKIKPTIGWQKIQVADFSDVHKYRSSVLAGRALWLNDIETIEIEDDTSEFWTSFFDAREPTLRCVLGVHYTFLDSGLMALRELLDEVQKGDTIDHKTEQWIYAFLACTRLPLIAETAHTLRDLARKCAEIRSHLNPEDGNVILSAAPLNLIICIVARYFGQYDLAD